MLLKSVHIGQLRCLPYIHEYISVMASGLGYYPVCRIYFRSKPHQLHIRQSVKCLCRGSADLPIVQVTDSVQHQTHATQTYAWYGGWEGSSIGNSHCIIFKSFGVTTELAVEAMTEAGLSEIKSSIVLFHST